MHCTQNKFTIFFIGLSLLGRVGSGHKSTDMLRVGSDQENLGSGRVGSEKSDPCPTLVYWCNNVKKRSIYERIEKRGRRQKKR